MAYRFLGALYNEQGEKRRMASRANRVIKPQKQLNGPIGYPSFLSEHLGVDGRVMPIFCDSAGNRSNFLLMYDRIRDNLFKLEGQFHSVNVSKIRSFKIEVHAQLIFTMRNDCVGELAHRF